MSHGVTKVLVESAVRSLNDKAERLGMLRRYEIDFGSPAKGQQHKIVEKVSGQVLGSTPIGNTLSKAHQYLLAMNQALAGAGTDHTAIHDDVARRGVTVYNGKPLGDPALVRMANRPNNFADPDARSARRPESER